MTISKQIPSPSPRVFRSLDQRDSGVNQVGPFRRLVLVRVVVWAVVGLIYAPLFIGLSSLFERLGAGSVTYLLAAALAGGSGAVLYGAREVGLVGTGIGLGVGGILLIGAGDLVSVQFAVVSAMGVAVLFGLYPGFPARCTLHVPGKALAGVLSGAVGGSVLAIVEPMHPHTFSMFSVMAFLVSVNGVLYVAIARPLVELTHHLRFQAGPCNLIEVSVVAILAGIAAGSVWVMAGPLGGEPGGVLQEVGQAVYNKLPLALLGGIFGGAVAGALLQAFGFRWVHDV